jgi:ABC-type multidrug transport system ATPase subunit
MLLGIIKPTSGNVLIFGERLENNPFATKHKIGMVSEQLTFYDEMTAWEYLTFFARLYEVEGSSQRMSELLERVNLLKWRDALVGNFSTGMKRKLALVRALLHSPQILILDEPVSGLDPFGIVQIREILLDEQKAGTTILVSSHILSEVERTADRVGMIIHGKLIAEDSMENLRAMVEGDRRIVLELLQVDEIIINRLKELPFVKKVDRNKNQIIIHTLVDQDYRPALGRMLSEQPVVIQGMQEIKPSLEEMFITITESNAHKWSRKLSSYGSNNGN